eukprot:5969233-Pleurochrysis_carterae.AAC.1
MQTIGRNGLLHGHTGHPDGHGRERLMRLARMQDATAETAAPAAKSLRLDAAGSIKINIKATATMYLVHQSSECASAYQPSAIYYYHLGCTRSGTTRHAIHGSARQSARKSLSQTTRNNTDDPMLPSEPSAMATAQADCSSSASGSASAKCYLAAACWRHRRYDLQTTRHLLLVDKGQGPH